MFNSKVKGPALEFGNELIGMGLYSANYRPVLRIKNGPWNFMKMADGVNQGGISIKQLIVTESGSRVIHQVELRRPNSGGKVASEGRAPCRDTILCTVSPLLSDATNVANLAGRESAQTNTKTRQRGIRGMNPVVPLHVTIRSKQGQ